MRGRGRLLPAADRVNSFRPRGPTDERAAGTLAIESRLVPGRLRRGPRSPRDLCDGSRRADVRRVTSEKHELMLLVQFKDIPPGSGP
jgi:hypothetical protein